MYIISRHNYGVHLYGTKFKTLKKKKKKSLTAIPQFRGNN